MHPVLADVLMVARRPHRGDPAQAQGEEGRGGPQGRPGGPPPPPGREPRGERAVQDELPHPNVHQPDAEGLGLGPAAREGREVHREDARRGDQQQGPPGLAHAPQAPLTRRGGAAPLGPPPAGGGCGGEPREGGAPDEAGGEGRGEGAQTEQDGREEPGQGGGVQEEPRP